MASPRNQPQRGSLTAERWREIKVVLSAALETDPAERDSYLGRACATDPSLRLEVENLLAVEQEAATALLENPAIPTASAGSGAVRIGRRIGSYQLVEEIGSGGMGEVYRAFRADDQYRKEVAVKLVRAGQDSQFIIARFKNERQVLAGLDHPNIARLLDGGTTDDGIPYLVMEMIAGQPITQYCDAHRLRTTDRLKLFLQVCSAVEYAHQRLIIHRDLKPGNILVTADGTPKLLDFGIAKILDPANSIGVPDRTMSMFRLLTPAYASPEQVTGEAVTTASDAYSLGVLLYECLTGHRPYGANTRAPHEIARAVCETEPEKPSTVIRRSEQVSTEGDSGEITPARVSAVRDGTPAKLNKRLRGDLDNIVLMALRKQPERRYQTVEQLASDIRRHLQKLPVAASRDTVRYRAAKFIARHRAGVTAALALVVVVLAGVAATLYEASRARQSEVRAERRFNDVRTLANSLIFEIHDSISDLPGATKAREVLVKRALEYLDSLSQESADPALARELATAYERIGDVQGNNTSANLDDFSGASASYGKAVAIREILVAKNPGDPNFSQELLGAYLRSIMASENMGDFASEFRTLEKARWLVSRLPATASARQKQFNMAGIYYYTARALEKTGKFSQALENYQKTISVVEPLARSPHASLVIRSYLGLDHIEVGEMLARVGRTGEAKASAILGLSMLRLLSQENPDNATLREHLADSYGMVADVLDAGRDGEGALRLFRRARKIYRDLAARDHDNQMAKADLAWSGLNIAEVLLRQGRTSESGPLVHSALSIFGEGDPRNRYWHAVEMAETYMDLGKISASSAERARSRLDKKRLWSEARASYQKALDMRSTGPGQLDSMGHDQVGEIRKELAVADAKLAQAYIPAAGMPLARPPISEGKTKPFGKR